MSGGVDSALSAALLKEAGYDVYGVFIKIWQPEFLECTWEEDRLDALRTAAALGIPFQMVDFSDAYREHVIEAMLAGYRDGLTPNPDVLCNRFIKFGALLKWADTAGFAYVATGHHARIETAFSDAPALLRGIDGAKDQSYFLWQLTQGDLRRTLLPVGNMEKAAVRSEAQRRNLPVAEKPDSQGLCFVGDIDMHTFLSRFLSVVPGELVDGAGAVIGEHRGAALYTLGQRHGLSVTNASYSQQPLYVTAIDVHQNRVTVAPTVREARRSTVYIERTNWMREKPHINKMYHAEVRYHQGAQACTVAQLEGDTAVVTFRDPQLAVPGQSLVLYENEMCLGGGVIAPADRS